MQILSWLGLSKKEVPQVVSEPPKSQEREVRELLRENLNVLPVDMFYADDPLMKYDGNERILYLKKFFDLFKDPFLTERIKYHVNIQAIKTLNESGTGIQDIAGAMNINGMAFIQDDIKRLANMYIKESTVKPETFNKFDIIPTMDKI